MSADFLGGEDLRDWFGWGAGGCRKLRVTPNYDAGLNGRQATVGIRPERSSNLTLGLE